MGQPPLSVTETATRGESRPGTATPDPTRPFRPSKSLRLIPNLSRTVRDHGSLDPCLGRIGPLEVRLATTAKEIRRAQKLRFKVFYEEMSAVPHAGSLLL